MAFQLPEYHAPDFTALQSAPDAVTAPAPMDGVAPEGYHSTSMYPEYFKIDGEWRLAEESRMDSSVVLRPDGHLDVVENRNLRAGDRVILGRTERGEEGIFLHAHGFDAADADLHDQFVFRQGRSRETSYARDYDRLIQLLKHEREHGNIVWVMGPAFAFDADARSAMSALIREGYCHGLLAGNALATHDLRRCGSIPAFVREYDLHDGILCACVEQNVPYVLTGSIRDDGPLPEVIGDVYAAQNAMRSVIRKATTVICLATMLHTIAAGNMTPSFRVLPDGTIRPVYLYAVDADEFVVNKLLDRGSLAATTMVTNVQDFIWIVKDGLMK